MYDCLIIGSGPSGMTAAIYCARNNLKVAIIEGNAPGGQMINTSEIANYPGFKTTDGASLAYAMYEQVQSLNVEYYYGYVKTIKKQNEQFIVSIDNKELESKTVIVATGAKNRLLNVPGEDKFSHHGISWCAICDGTFYKNQDVAVIGGGNSSLEEAIYLSSLASHVYVIHRRNQFRAEDGLVEKAKSISNISFVLDVTILEFVGDDKLKAIKVRDNQTQKEELIAVNGAFEYVGLTPASEILKEFDVTNEEGYIIVDEQCQTKVKGLFASGDVIKKQVRQITTAVSDGAIAALNASKYCK